MATKQKSQQNNANSGELTKHLVKPQCVKEGWWNMTTNWVKKKYFNGAHALDLTFNDQKSDNLWLFGQEFKSNQDARSLYQSILWFTYRENLKFYEINLEFNTSSDVGWGCMIRVGQMMIAHCLRRNQGLQYFDDTKFIQNLLQQFIQKQGLFSVEKIAKRAYEIYEIKPGQWYSPSEIAFILSDIQNANLQSRLKVIVYDNEFQLSKTIHFLDENNSKKNLNKMKPSLNNQADIKTDPGLIIILIRIGYTSPEKQLLESVIFLLKQQKNCIGILGGHSGKAHYLFGTTEKSFIYLDPHCVKETDGFNQFFCRKSMFSISHNSIDPSMALCFYVRNKTQLILLYDRFSKIKQKLPFYSYSKCLMPEIMQKQEESSQFQVL